MTPNNENAEPTPLEPDQLDELLSAELDGEFGAAASELGLSAEAALARIRVTPGADDRRAALVAARDLLAEAPPVDELLAARLRAKAVRTAEIAHSVRTEDRRRRRNRILMSAGGIAAAVAAIAAIAGGAGGFHPDGASSKASSAASPETSAEHRRSPSTHAPTAPATGTAPTSLGAFSDVRSLAVAAVKQDVVDRNLATERLKSSLGTAYGTNDGRAAAPVVVDGPQTSSADKSVQDRTQNSQDSTGFAAKCNAPPEVHVIDAPVLRATATLSGKPVVVLVFANATEHVVVVEDTNCKLVNLQTFR